MKFALTFCLLLTAILLWGCKPRGPVPLPGPANTTNSPGIDYNSNSTSITSVVNTNTTVTESSDSNSTNLQDNVAKNNNAEEENQDPKSKRRLNPNPESREILVKPSQLKKKLSNFRGGTLDLTFDDLRFDIEKDAPFFRKMLPPEIEKLKTNKIRLRGYILPSFHQRDIKQFVLVRDNLECCFGPGAALYDCVMVEMEGSGVDFTVRPVTVEGEFDIQEYKGGDGKHLAIYHMTGTDVN